MDRLTGAFNSFSGGNNNNNQQQYSQDQNQGGYGNQDGYQNQGGYQGQGQSQGGYGGQSQGGYQGGYPEENRQSHQGQSSGGAGGFLGNLGLGGGNNNQQQQGGYQGQQQQQGGSGGFLGGLGDKFNSAAGGGRESEKNEDYLDKGVDFVQERFLGQGPQDNESAIEQAKDEQISDFIRGKYKSTTGSDIPIKDKETRFG